MGRMDEREFTAFYKANYKSLVGYVYGKTRNADDAEEIVQEAFSQFLGSYNSDFKIEEFNYLLTVCNNALKNFWKSSVRTEKVLDFNSRLLQTLVQDLSVDVEDEFIRKEEELTNIINDELNELPALYRDILIKYYYDGKSQDEIAQEFSQQWVSELLYKGRRRLKIRLTKRGIK